MPAWRLYLLVALVAGAASIALPLGVARSAVYLLVGLSSAVAIWAGVRRHRPAHPLAWYLFAAGTASSAVAGWLDGWYGQSAPAASSTSLADVFHLAVYPLLAAGILGLVQRRGAAHRQPTGLDETAILTVGLGLLAWIVLIEPTWTSFDQPFVSRVVGVAYPICGVLLFAVLMRLAPATARQPAFLIVTGSVSAMLLADTLPALGVFVPAIAGHPNLLALGWLLSFVLWGTAALHPSMRDLSSPPPPRPPRLSAVRLVGLGVAVAVGPTILGSELIAGHPPDVWPVVIAAGCTMVLALIQIRRILRLLDSQRSRLVQLADTDYVTGLMTCERFADRLGAFLDDSRGQVAGFLLINVERFAQIHDTLGHQTGDAILHAVAVRLSEQRVGGAFVGRMGGNTFGVLDPSITSGEDADRAAAWIRRLLEVPFNLPNLAVSVEVSVGSLLLPEDGAEPGIALLRADVALSAARTRSERTARFGIGMDSGEMLAPLVIGELREAMERGDIVVHYQPQVELRSGRVFGVEALVRWHHPRFGLLGPDTFIPSAEQTGLIGPLTQFVLDEALDQCARWLREGLDLKVAVNLSVRNLLDPGLVDDVRSALRSHGLQATSLELEITESSAMVNLRRSIQVLEALTELGVTLSIDDYGTGHSSLAYLQKLPVGRLKIDRAFVTGMLLDPASAAIVDSTIELARVLQFDVVAEGVEDDATLLRLRDMRCSTAQGFDLGPPVDGSLLPELITSIEERLALVLGAPEASRG